MNENIKTLIQDVFKSLPEDCRKECEEPESNIPDILKKFPISFIDVKTCVRKYINLCKAIKIEKFNNFTYEEIFKQSKLHGINLITTIMENAIQQKEEEDKGKKSFSFFTYIVVFITYIYLFISVKYNSVVSDFMKHGTIIGIMRRDIVQIYPTAIEIANNRISKKINDVGIIYFFINFFIFFDIIYCYLYNIILCFRIKLTFLYIILNSYILGRMDSSSCSFI